MKANEKQVGGKHYQSEYQHWDFIFDTKLNYFSACATKYIARWRNKDGLKDLKKAKHFIEKIKELGVVDIGVGSHKNTKHFIQINHIPPEEGYLIHDIVFGEYDTAIQRLDILIKQAEKHERPMRDGEEKEPS